MPATSGGSPPVFPPSRLTSTPPRFFRGDPRYGGSDLPLAYTTMRVAWLRYYAEAGVTATIHQLRHSQG
jgi:hypothetical protein